MGWYLAFVVMFVIMRSFFGVCECSQLGGIRMRLWF
jgi:hypothetical protein